MHNLPNELFNQSSSAGENPITPLARRLIDEQNRAVALGLEGNTLVIEFARGGPKGAQFPLRSPIGYAASLAQLSPAILRNAAILYVYVTPEQSHEKNRARMPPPGCTDTGIFHFVPQDVMDMDYGCDDMKWLAENSDVPGTIAVPAHGNIYHLPVAFFDNSTHDLTSFAREKPEAWTDADKDALGNALKYCLQDLHTRVVERMR